VLVCSHTACDDERSIAGLIEGAATFRDEGVDNSLLKFRCEISACAVVEFEASSCDDDCRLQPTETEVESGAIQHGAREFEATRGT
jgi:hypothetical protein